MDNWQFDNTLGDFPDVKGVYIVDVGFGYSIKYDGLRDCEFFTAISPDCGRISDCENLMEAIGHCVWHKTLVDRNFIR